MVSPLLRKVFGKALLYNYWEFQEGLIYVYTTERRNWHSKMDNFSWNKEWISAESFPQCFNNKARWDDPRWKQCA